ncbi:hypothetical protein [Methylobacterium sp. WSM2598]|uniref:hypothetical protein n=1 Tax=Methylobacterium sp. WSM2598 TaxID=398261 RepID=UPI0012F6A117|nr:hypothetical protein [Methylobacterium sp. WSM2598]
METVLVHRRGVGHQVHVEVGRHRRLDLVRAAAERAGAVTRPVHRPGLHVERGEQAGGAVPGVVVAAPLGRLARGDRRGDGAGRDLPGPALPPRIRHRAGRFSVP